MGGDNGIDLQVRSNNFPGSARPMADDPDVTIDGRKCVVRFVSLILRIGLLLLFACWLPSSVFEGISFAQSRLVLCC